MESWQDTESARYKQLTVLAAETSPSNRVSTNNSHDTSQPRPFHQSSEEQDKYEEQSVQSISCDSNEVSETVVHHEVAVESYCSNGTVDSLGIMANSPSSKDGTCEMQPTGDSVVFSECSGGKNNGITHGISESGDVLDKLAHDGCETQPSDQSLQSNPHDVVDGMSDVCIENTNHSSNGDDQTHHLHDLNGQTLSPVTAQPVETVRQGDDTNQPTNYNGQSLCLFDQTGRSTDCGGQKACHVDQLVMLTKLPGRSVIELRPDDQIDLCDGQVKMVRNFSVDQTVHPTYHNGQIVCPVGEMDQSDGRDVEKMLMF